ncbi:MAG: hypothetical protein PHP57_02825 [Sideroxydans sp.]|nr:hypothetical protein [Sideroxydans sp.]
MKRQYGVRLNPELQKEVEEFAIAQGMKPTTAAEFFVKLGLQSLKKSEQEQNRLDELEARLEGKLKLIYGSLAKAVINLQLAIPPDQERGQRSAEFASEAVKKLFG